MKKIFSILLSALLLSGSLCLTAYAETESPVQAEVYVTVSNQGSLALVQEKITATDKNQDGRIDLDEVLFAAHEAKYEGGAVAGYASYVHAEYGISLGMLWGDSSGAFGYYVNDSSAMSLGQTVTEGDRVCAYIYADTVTWSDCYSYFDVTRIEREYGAELTLTLSCAGYDEFWNPVTLPVEGASITINGVATGVVTDAEGKATVHLETSGIVVISATSESMTLVPPVCVAEVAAGNTEETSPDTNTDAPAADANADTGCGSLISTSLLPFLLLFGTACVAVTVKRNDEA